MNMFQDLSFNYSFSCERERERERGGGGGSQLIIRTQSKTKIRSVVIHTSVCTSAVADWVLARASRASSKATYISSTLSRHDPGIKLGVSADGEDCARWRAQRDSTSGHNFISMVSLNRLYTSKKLHVKSSSRRMDNWKKLACNLIVLNISLLSLPPLYLSYLSLSPLSLYLPPSLSPSPLCFSISSSILSPSPSLSLSLSLCEKSA